MATGTCRCPAFPRCAFERLTSLAPLLIALSACGSSTGPAELLSEPPLSVEQAWPELSFEHPTGLFHAPGDDSRWYVTEQSGRILWFDSQNKDTAVVHTYLDYSEVVDDRFEGGMLGMAFHPRFDTNRQVYVSYTAPGVEPGENMQSRVSRMRDVGGRLDPDSEEVLLRVGQPWANHNGGNIAFGPDGYLYIGLGDGGAAGDPHNNAQDTTTLLGAMLRIDVDREAPYAIPPDNPLIGTPGPRAEIFAWGLRNPWGWGFDRAPPHRLWLADVGQNKMEEVDIVEKGGNYGWRCYEGTLEYDMRDCGDPARFTFPVAEYRHDQGYSVTGGRVYRGGALPALQGVYIFGDYGSGTIWGLFGEISRGLDRRVLATTPLSIVGFAEDIDGEILIVDYEEGELYRVVPAES